MLFRSVVLATASACLSGCKAHSAESLLPDATSSPPAFLQPAQMSSGTLPIPELRCPSVDYRKWRTWEDVGAGLRNAPTCAMGQNWKRDSDRQHQPGTVAIAHFGNELIIYAELVDTDIFNSTKQSVINAYDFGDTLEIFLRSEKGEEYIEHHITPDNVSFQFKWPNARAIHNLRNYPGWRQNLVGDVPVLSKVLVQPELNMWRILAIVPLEKLSKAAPGEFDRTWRFSVSRYDYTRTEERRQLSLSSTSPHRRSFFHTQSAWGLLELVD